MLRKARKSQFPKIAYWNASGFMTLKRREQLNVTHIDPRLGGGETPYKSHY